MMLKQNLQEYPESSLTHIIFKNHLQKIQFSEKSPKVIQIFGLF